MFWFTAAMQSTASCFIEWISSALKASRIDFFRFRDLRTVLWSWSNYKSEQKTNARLRWKFYQFTLTILFIVDFILLTVQYSKLERMPMLFRWMRPFMILVSREKIGHVMLVIIRVIIRMYRFWIRSYHLTIFEVIKILSGNIFIFHIYVFWCKCSYIWGALSLCCQLWSRSFWEFLGRKYKFVPFRLELWEQWHRFMSKLWSVYEWSWLVSNRPIIWLVWPYFHVSPKLSWKY